MGAWLPRPAQRAAPVRASTRLHAGRRQGPKLSARPDGVEPPFNIVQFNVMFDADARRRLARAARRRTAERPAVPKPTRPRSALIAPDALQQATALDFRTYLVDDILAKVDRASMLCSLEVRAPFLDPRLIDFAFRRVPDRLRATARERKDPAAAAGRARPAPRVSI